MWGKVCEVFTKKYREETNHREIALKTLRNFRLKDAKEGVEDKVKRLVDKNLVSEFKVTVGDYPQGIKAAQPTKISAC